MTTVQEIEKAVFNLPSSELEEFRAWFAKFDAEVWDRQFEQDALEGRLDKLADGAIKDFEGGQCKPI